MKQYLAFFDSCRRQTLAIACIGTAVFWWLQLPLPFLFGPMFGCLAAVLLGVRLKGFGEISTCARTILGVAIGSTITPAFFLSLPTIGMSLAIVPIFLLLIAIVAVPFFHHIFKLDKMTAYYAAMPGGLQDMVLFGIEAGADPRALSLIQATRVFCIVTFAPILMLTFFDASLNNEIGEPLRNIPLFEIVMMIIAGLAGWKIAQKIGLFGASILGPLILTAIFSMLGLIHMRPPKEAILVAQFFIGIVIGVQFVGITITELRKFVFAGMIYVLLISSAALGIAWIVSRFGIAPPLEAFLAFSPGGQAEMTILAISSGAEIGFVVSHHLTRLVFVITCAPIFVRYFTREKPRH